ncbi:MAG: chemotaxis protein CheX [Pyrinomonadaceae bacterium]
MKEALYQATVSTFEELGFLFPLMEDEEPTATDDTWIHVNVAYHGNENGNLVVSFQNGVITTMAENMLDDVGEDEELILDVAGELGNVICGNVLPFVFGDQAVFNLDAPRFEEADNAIEPEASTKVEFEEGSVELKFYRDK